LQNNGFTAGIHTLVAQVTCIIKTITCNCGSIPVPAGYVCFNGQLAKYNYSTTNPYTTLLKTGTIVVHYPGGTPYTGGSYFPECCISGLNIYGSYSQTGVHLLSTDNMGNYYFNATNGCGSVPYMFGGTFSVPVSGTIQANPTASPTSGTAPLTVSFRPNFTGVLEGGTTVSSISNLTPTFLWDFGDNTTSSLRDATHTYQNAGTYTPSLTITVGTITHTFTNFVSIVVSSVVSKFIINASSSNSSCGSVSPSTATLSSALTSQTFTFTPASGQTATITGWTLDGITISNSSGLTSLPLALSYLQNNGFTAGIHTLVAQVTCTIKSLISLNISASPSDGGTVSPTSISNIVSSTNTVITATPNSNYQFSGWTLNGSSLTNMMSSISVSSIFALLRNGVNTLIANFKLIQVLTTKLQFLAGTGGTITNQNQTLDITNYLTDPGKALLNIVANVNSGYEFNGFTLNGIDITSYTNTVSSIGCISQTIRSAINQITLANLIQNFKNYIQIGSTNILQANFALLPWKMSMNCPCQSNGSAQCSFTAYDINNNVMYNVPIFVKVTIDGVVKNCYNGNTSQSYNTGTGLGTEVVDVYAVRNLNAHATSNTIGIPCITLRTVSPPTA
jgi:hypothetical protein